MRIRKENLGNGVVRLVIEPMLACENNVPTHAVERMVKDVIAREKGCCPTCGEIHKPWVCYEEPKRPSWLCCEEPRFTRPCNNHVIVERPTREPDGIDVHVDRPLRENFFSHRAWCDAMAKYRTLENVAKDCNWECREPMKGTHPNYDFQKPTNTRCCHETPWWMVEDDDDEEDVFGWWN